MNFDIIETRRLILKGLSPDDMKYIFGNHSKPEIKRILVTVQKKVIKRKKAKHRNGYSSYNWSFKLFLLTDKASDTIIGRCVIHNWNAEHRRAEIGYVMEVESYKRKGLMTESLDVIIEYGFNKMNLNRIEAFVGIGNIPSLRLMEKYNFIKAGVLRQHYYASDKYEDSVLFSKLYHEYK